MRDSAKMLVLDLIEFAELIRRLVEIDEQMEMKTMQEVLVNVFAWWSKRQARSAIGETGII